MHSERPFRTRYVKPRTPVKEMQADGVTYALAIMALGSTEVLRLNV
jgi:hypothetical protein